MRLRLHNSGQIFAQLLVLEKLALEMRLCVKSCFDRAVAKLESYYLFREQSFRLEDVGGESRDVPRISAGY